MRQGVWLQVRDVWLKMNNILKNKVGVGFRAVGTILKPQVFISGQI